MPTLDEVVQVAARGRRQLLLEIKVDDRRQRYPEIEEKTLAVLDRHGMGPSTIVMAFEAETWRRMRELRPGQRAGALYSGRTLAALASDAPREMEAAHKAGVAFVGLQHALVTPATVALARRLGLTLGAWTVNDAPGDRARDPARRRRGDLRPPRPRPEGRRPLMRARRPARSLAG